VSLAVLASRVRYEEKLIFAALDRHGASYVHVDPRRLIADPDGTWTGTADPSGVTEPSGVTVRFEAFEVALNREISQSRGYYASLLLEARGVRTVNRSEVIGVCGDKLRTSVRLAAAGVRTPRTSVALTPESGIEAAERLGYPVVVKPLTGSWGRLGALLRDRIEAQSVLEHRAALPNPQQHIVYLQEFIKKPDRDIRVLVAGDRVVGATYRHSPEWRTNAALGGHSTPCPLSPDLCEKALAAAAAVGGGLLGVDLIEGPDGLYVLEVNHTMEFRGFQTAHGDTLDVADEIVSYLLDPS
jgi:[lysine-biosynthesis-protein LysW]---L-2-aminoadipate ligase